MRRGTVRRLLVATLAAAEHNQWDGLQDALEPVRSLVAGPHALVPRPTYEAHRNAKHRVLARISPVRTRTAWAFFAVRGAASGAPRWLLLEEDQPAAVVGLDRVSARLRDLLASDPPNASFDDHCETVLAGLIERAERAEVELLPRRHQRAVDQMQRMCRRWAEAARSTGQHDDADRWEVIAGVARGESEMGRVDLHQAAEAWLVLVKPTRLEARASRTRRRSAYSRLADIEPILHRSPLALDDVELAMSRLEIIEPLAQRVASCILGVPARF